jgi:hypothetical protein
VDWYNTGGLFSNNVSFACTGEDSFVADIKLVDFGLSTFIPNKHLQAEAKTKDAATRSDTGATTGRGLHVQLCSKPAAGNQHYDQSVLHGHT